MLPNLPALEQEYGILHLIYHRSKNQHRQQVWFRYLAIIHRKVRKIIAIAGGTATKHRDARIVEVVKYLVAGKVFKKAFYEFHGILALGQYVNLGFALLGSISAIHSILMGIEGVKGSKNTKVIEYKSNDDLGEEIEKCEVGVKRPIAEEPKKTKKPLKVPSYDMDAIFAKKPKKSKKKKKSAMDEIFG